MERKKTLSWLDEQLSRLARARADEAFSRLTDAGISPTEEMIVDLAMQRGRQDLDQLLSELSDADFVRIGCQLLARDAKRVGKRKCRRKGE